MELISVPLSRSIWHIDVNEINPRGKNIFVDLVPALIETYHFKTFPGETGDFKEGMRFGQGTYNAVSGDPLMVGFWIWRDGLGADTFSSTNDSDEFLEDIARTISARGYQLDRAMIRKQTYTSQVHVRCKKQLSALGNFADFASRVSVAVGQPFEFAAFEVWPDQTRQDKPLGFSFQRLAGDPMTGDRYWSQAPLPTDEHMKLLQVLEQLLG